MDDLSGKRKRKTPNCPNPLFVHWLTEWKNDAADKGLKTQYTYGKVNCSIDRKTPTATYEHAGRGGRGA